jgi:hypothetical protein
MMNIVKLNYFTSYKVGYMMTQAANMYILCQKSEDNETFFMITSPQML